MSTLRFRLGEKFGIDTELCEWLHVDARGETLATGFGSPREWPQAERHLGVVCAARARLMRIALPDLPPAKFAAALGFAVETRIAGDPERQHIVAAKAAADGKRNVIVLEKAWLEHALQAIKPAQIVSLQLVAECELPAVPADTWWWNADVQHGFVLTSEDSFALEPGDDPGHPPLPLQLALERAAALRPARLIVAGDAVPADSFASWRQRLGVAIDREPRWQWSQAPTARFDAATSLLASPSKATQESGSLKRELRLAGAVLFIAAALHLSFSIGVWARAWWHESRLLGDAQAIAHDAFGSDAKGEASLAAARSAYAAARHAAGEPAPTDALPLLARAGAALATLPPGSLHQARFADGRWTLDLSALDAASRDRLLSSLAANGLTALHAEQPGGLRIALQDGQP